MTNQPPSTPGETPVTRIRRLLLANETVVFACTECDFTASALGMVRSHLPEHNAGPRRKTGPRQKPAASALPLDATLGDLLDQHRRAEVLLATVERQAEELAEWRARAKAAEKDLATLRRVLGGALGT